MGNRPSDPRSFNTVKHSHREQRRQRRKLARKVLLSICTVVMLLVLSGLIFLICTIAHSCKLNKPTSDSPVVPTGESEIEYKVITKFTSDIYVGSLIVVNKEQEYQFPSADKDSTAGLITVTSRPTDGEGNPIYQLGSNISLRNEAYEAFTQMLTAYANLSDDRTVKLNEAFRTYSKQQDNYNKSSTKTSAGYSDHHTGYLLALGSTATKDGSLTNEQKSWLASNAAKYGFIQRYPDSHAAHTGVTGYENAYRYVGEPHASYMKQYDLCLEDYVELLQTSYTDHHLCITVGSRSYEVYYVKASESGITTLEVPTNYPYELSGDNIGGFIVTVKLGSASE